MLLITKITVDPVAPRAGAWIEIVVNHYIMHIGEVAPRAGAWIEIDRAVREYSAPLSLPVRERGLR